MLVCRSSVCIDRYIDKFICIALINSIESLSASVAKVGKISLRDFPK